MQEQVPLYEGKHMIRMGDPKEPFFYCFDYDERSHSVNMEFQHFHGFYEIFILLDDEASHIIEGQLYTLSLYDIVCLPPGLLHKTQYPVGLPKKRLIITFSLPEPFFHYLPEYKQLLSLFDEQVPIFRFSGAALQSLISALNRIYLSDRAASSIQGLTTFQMIVDFLTVLYNNRARNQYKPVSTLGALTDKIYDICAYISAHFDEPLGLSGLAKQFYLSDYYLSHKFKEVTQFTLTDYIQHTRIRNAQQALMFSREHITQIAQACGFKSFAQFNRVFHKHCGISPSQYRKENVTLWEQP